MVVLTNEASLNYLQTETFTVPGFKVRGVESFTSPKGKRIKTMVEERKNESLVERLFTYDPNADEIAGYREVLCIELEERGKEKVLEAIALLEQREDVLYAGPDYMITGCAEDTDNVPQLNYLNQAETIDLPQAHAMITNPSPSKVAVLDTGIDAGHDVLSHFVVEEKSENYVDYEKTGTMELAHITDPHGHGTHVAGIIAATAVNVELISLRVLDSNNNGYSSYVEAAIEKVTELWSQGYIIPIINLSARWIDESPYYNAPLNEVIQQYPGLFVCGAGNEHKYIKEYGNSADDIAGSVYVYPASYDVGFNDRMIVVGASNRDDNGLWDAGVDEYGNEVGSNYGPLTVDIFAPGQWIQSCYPKSLCHESFCTNAGHSGYGYHKISGTSMATPYVAGVAALIKSVHPNLGAAAIKQIILNSAETVIYNGTDVYADLCSSGGRLNAYNALYASHTFGAWVDLNTTYHQRTCIDCGYTQLQAHSECWDSLKDMCTACKRTGPVTDVVLLQPSEEEKEQQ